MVYVLGLNAQEAVAISLVIVGIVSLIGVIPHWRLGNVNLTTAIASPLALNLYRDAGFNNMAQAIAKM